jgi:hypothetical protein
LNQTFGSVEAAERAALARVMKVGGSCLSTFFILDNVSRENVSKKLTMPSFGFTYSPGCRVFTMDVPEAAVAYEESFLQSGFQTAGLKVQAINVGQWARGDFVPHWQDEVWLCKMNSSARGTCD